ncbi:MAG: hypothetical protein FWC19_00260 [Treponema sp.]|nr:hypothetical protein [Treponema sp.]
MKKNKIIFSVIALMLIINFLAAGCGNPQGGELEIHNATGSQDSFYAVVIFGAFSQKEVMKKIREYSAEDRKNNVIRFLNDEKKKYSVFENSVVTYYWWTEKGTEESNFEKPALYDFGSKFIDNGNVVTVTAK